MSILDTPFKEYIKTHMEELNEAFYGDVSMFFYKNNKRMTITGKDIPEFLSEDGQDAFANRAAFFKKMTQCAKNRNKMVDFVDNYFMFDEKYSADDLENMNGKWFGFEPVDKMKPLYCMPIDSKKKIDVVFAMDIE